MAIHVAFTEKCGQLNNLSYFTERTTTDRRRTDNSRIALQWNNVSVDLFSYARHSDLTTGWAHIMYWSPTTNVAHNAAMNNQYSIGLVDQDDIPVVGLCRLPVTGGNTTVGVLTRWTSLSDGVVGPGDLVPIVFHWNIHDTNGFVRVYVDNSLVSEYEGDTTDEGDITSINGLRFSRLSHTSGTIVTTHYHVSEVMVADECLLGAAFVTLPIDTTGTVNDWTGSYADINGHTLDDGTEVVADTNLDTFTRELSTSLTVPTGTAAPIVCVNARARADSDSAVKDLAGVVRIGSTNYTSDPVTLGEGFAGQLFMFPLNPATSAAWTDSVVNDAEFGLQAQT